MPRARRLPAVSDVASPERLQPAEGLQGFCRHTEAVGRLGVDALPPCSRHVCAAGPVSQLPPPSARAHFSRMLFRPSGSHAPVHRGGHGDRHWRLLPSSTTWRDGWRRIIGRSGSQGRGMNLQLPVCAASSAQPLRQACIWLALYPPACLCFSPCPCCAGEPEAGGVTKVKEGIKDALGLSK